MSTFGQTITPYQSWLNLTRPTRVYGPDRLINDATKNTYLLADMIKGRSKDHLIRAGKEWEEPIMLNDLGNYAEYTPGQERTTSRTDFNYMMRGPFRFSEAHFPYTEPEVEMNEKDPWVKFKTFTNSWRQVLHTTVWNGMENTLFRKPDKANMEDSGTGAGTQTPGKTYSILNFVTEDGLVPPANNGTFTTIETLSPATYSGWRNAVSGYDASAIDDEATGLFAAFERIMLKVDYKQVPGFSKYQESDDLSKLKIVTNADGRTTYSNRLRASNDQTRAGAQDPAYGMPVWQGIPIYHATSIQDQTDIEQNPAGTYTSNSTAGYPAGRPRYFFLNLNYLFPVFCGDHLMKELPPISGGSRQRDAFVVYVENWWQLVCTSRRRQGIVTPTATPG